MSRVLPSPFFCRKRLAAPCVRSASMESSSVLPSADLIRPAAIAELSEKMEALCQIKEQAERLEAEIKAGFSGARTDKLGRRRCYADGKPTTCPEQAPAAVPQSTAPSPESQKVNAKPKTKKVVKVSQTPVPPPPQKQMSDRAARAKAAHKMVDEKIQRYAEEYNEPRLARSLGGESFPDGEPMDVAIPADEKNLKVWNAIMSDYQRKLAAFNAAGRKGARPESPKFPGAVKHGFEVKTMVDNSNSKLTMDSYAQVRKIMWERESGASFHTIVSNDQEVYEANGPDQHDQSKRTYFYRRGVAGSARTGTMHHCKTFAEVKRLIELPEDQLPAGAERTDKHITDGDWEFYQVIEKVNGKDKVTEKGYKDRKTGRVVKAKK
jgi:hypothetical protein